MKEEQRINGIFLAANTLYGVFTIAASDIDSDADILSAWDFYESLSTLPPGKTIYSHFTGDQEEIFDAIKSEYGIDTL